MTPVAAIATIIADLTVDEALLVAIHTLCPKVKLCRIALIASLIGMDPAQLTGAFRDAVAAGNVIVLGAPTQLGFVWLTAKGTTEARRLLAERELQPATS